VKTIPRIIAGKYKGLLLKAPKGKSTRPTIDRTKEALFSIILPYLKEAVVLDLFAGTGSLGLEALSRGAKFVYLNDYNRNSNIVIKENITKCKINDNYLIMQLDYKKAINRINEKVDVVFLDPPYEKGFIALSIEKLLLNDIISADGIIVCEHSKNEIMRDDFVTLKLIMQRKYGIANISIYKKEEVI